MNGIPWSATEPRPSSSWEGLSHTRGDVEILRDLSLSVARGEYVALMGANGSGKTTLIRHLNGTLRPMEGSVIVDGLSTDDDRNLPIIRRAVGLVFQDPDDQMVAVTAEDEIAFGLEVLCQEHEEMVARVEEALERFHLTHVRDRATTSLSGGEQQRVAIASIWAADPEVMILDEPTSMLDRPSATELLRLLDDMTHGSTAKTVIHVTQQGLRSAKGRPRRCACRGARRPRRDAGRRTRRRSAPA